MGDASHVVGRCVRREANWACSQLGRPQKRSERVHAHRACVASAKVARSRRGHNELILFPESDVGSGSRRAIVTAMQE